MIKVGILGEIGSGKSYVSSQFNCPIFEADKIVSNIYKTNIKCFKKLKKKFPKFIKKFPIQKTDLIKIILSNYKNLNKINKIVHPLVRLEMKNFLKRYKNKKIVILDIPLLVENKLYDKKFVLVYVSTKKEVIKKRLKKRNNYNTKLYVLLKKTQKKISFKKKISDFVIDNNFNRKITKKNVKIIKSKILKNETHSFRY